MINAGVYLSLVFLAWWLLTSLLLDACLWLLDAIAHLHRFAVRLDAEAAYFRSLVEREQDFDYMNSAFENNWECLEDAMDALERIADLARRGDVKGAIHECERAYEALDGGPLPEDVRSQLKARFAA